MSLKFYFDPDERAYSGRELRSHFIYETYGLAGDAAAAFIGPCDVGGEDLVDLTDVKDGAFIHSPKMLHFLVEHFDTDLEQAIYRQRLLVALAAELIRNKMILAGDASSDPLVRRGDDIFYGRRKLSVSVATASPVSTLIHLGLNIETEGAPVPAIGLAELGIDPASFYLDVFPAYEQELAGITAARAKVRPVP